MGTDCLRVPQCGAQSLAVVDQTLSTYCQNVGVYFWFILVLKITHNIDFYHYQKFFSML